MKTKTSKVADDYFKLVQQFPLVAIRSQKHCDQAAAFIEPLAISGEKTLSKGEADYLYAMSDLIDAFESRAEMSTTSPLDTLRFLMNENEMTASDLGRLLGSRGLGTLILNGKRELSKAHIRILAERFAVSPALFL